MIIFALILIISYSFWHSISLAILWKMGGLSLYQNVRNFESCNIQQYVKWEMWMIQKISLKFQVQLANFFLLRVVIALHMHHSSAVLAIETDKL